jgi:HEAT repeat protein
MKRVLRSSILLATLAVAFGQEPRIANAKLEKVSANGGLANAIAQVTKQQTAPVWVAYSIPTTARDRRMCCFNSGNQWRVSDGCCSGCRLEGDNNFFSGTTNSQDCGPLENDHIAFVFIRFEQQAATKIRTFSTGCAIDASSMPVFWLTDVKPAESVDFLSRIVSGAADDSERRSVRGGALVTIAIHDDAAADRAMEKFMAKGQPDRLREQTALFLGSERGKRGLEILRAAVKDDPSDRFREKALIGFAQNRSQEGINDLIRIGHEDPSTRVRGQAIFWLAQAGGKKVAQQITDTIENDPETEVKKKAVFALTQMPEHEGVPMLIQVAKTNKNPVVRKQAIFWLGQSHDPRALDYLEEILSK